MKIIIPMAGEGSRFQKIGFIVAKHQIRAKGKTLFHWSMLSLSDFFECDFVFIARKSHSSKAFIEGECRDLGIASFEIIEITHKTDGQASTVVEADPLMEEHDEVAIYNIDTYTEQGYIRRENIPSAASGYLPAFEAEGDKWSFVKTEHPKSSKVVEVSEKVRISNLATIGFYYFNKWSDFKGIYIRHRWELISQYKETYIAPMYRYLIDQKKPVYTSVIDNSAIHVLGTPEDIQTFHSDYLSENKTLML